MKVLGGVQENLTDNSEGIFLKRRKLHLSRKCAAFPAAMLFRLFRGINWQLKGCRISK